MGLSWLLFALGLGAMPTEFRLDTDTPDALCPELTMARDAVAKRLGKLEVEGGGTWRGTYSTVHDPGGQRGDYVRLVIVDPKGREQAARELPLKGESCATMAQAIALVVDGFFRDFGQAPSPAATPTPPLEPSRPEAESSHSEPAPTAPSSVSSAVREPEPPSDRAATDVPSTPVLNREKAGTGFGMSLGAGYESVPSSVAADLGLFVAPTPSWRFELRAALPTARASEARAGAVAFAYPIPVRLGVALTGSIAQDLAWFAGPEFLFGFERGTVERVSNGHTEWRLVFGPGIHGGAVLWMTPSLALSGRVSADAVVVQSGRFLVVDNPVLDLPRARLAGTFEVWGVIFR